MPDWERASFVSGGYLAEVPEPHLRRYPHPGVKRGVSIQVMRYYGVGVHYYVSVYEERNDLWDARTGCWCRCWDDEEDRGRSVHSPQFQGMGSLHQWVRELLAEEFPEEAYEYRWQDFTDEAGDRSDRPRWFYRDGD